MHELYIAESILKSALKSLPPNIPPLAVQKICVRIGQLDAVVADTLIFLFDAVKNRYGLENSVLEVEEEKVLCRCPDCGNEFSIDLPLFICPRCNGGNAEIMQGRGITLVRMIAEDEEPGGK